MKRKIQATKYQKVIQPLVAQLNWTNFCSVISEWNHNNMWSPGFRARKTVLKSDL